MGREKKSPGLKILWVWTIGTAAILVASVVRTRMHDMETMMNQEQAPPKQNQNDFHGSVEAFNVNAVDTTGAGDSFIGGFLSQIVDDQSVLEEEERLRIVLRFSNACEALCFLKDN
ncbi:unnamed protein product [Brassica rapa]|uniref:Carbohydrate kinase PfkB domain-containing protein n=2 Tax=Brassica TaxID=3705 RepID=A0A8D9CZ06_BRACM|nr:unnamed protein product [Brassica napus]CAG7867517.1 unnamed protein product [Brassica rapa]